MVWVHLPAHRIHFASSVFCDCIFPKEKSKALSKEAKGLSCCILQISYDSPGSGEA